MISFRTILGAAALAHATLFLPAGFLSVKPHYGVVLAPSSVDVSLVQMPEPQPVMDTAPKVLVARDPVPETPSVPTQEESPKPPEPKEREIPSQAPPKAQDSVSAAGARGAMSEAMTDHLKNSPPVYPSIARRRGWEGVVVLRVRVSAAGRAEGVNVEQSSGFQALDDAAVRAVREWIFSPAHLGALALSSEVRIPIRFQLTE